MTFALVALALVPGLAAAGMLAVAIPAGDAVDDSVLILLGVPAVVSALVTFMLALVRDRPPTDAAMWALGSGLLAPVWFGVVFVVGVLAEGGLH